MVHELKQSEIAGFLFEGWQETLIWSCLQYIMGHLYADDPGQPVTAKAVLGDFCFLAGRPDAEIILHKPASCRQDFMIMVPQDGAWADLIECCYKEKATKVLRYAIKKEPAVFDRHFLQGMTETLLDGFTLKMMDEDLFHRCRKLSWCRDWVSQYRNYELYQRHGLGAVILKDGEPVSGASSYAGYLGGIEIEIDTKQEYRRKGLASACGAKLVLACLERG